MSAGDSGAGVLGLFSMVRMLQSCGARDVRLVHNVCSKGLRLSKCLLHKLCCKSLLCGYMVCFDVSNGL